MTKLSKIVVIFGIIALVGVLGYFGWRFLFATPETTTTETPGTFLPKKLSDDRAFDYWINKTTGDTYYVREDGQLSVIDASGHSSELGSQTIGNLSEVRPSPDASHVLVGFGFPQSPTFVIYTTGTKTWTPLPVNTVSAAWDPASSNRVLYLRDNGNSSQLGYFTISDKKTAAVATFAQKELSLDWFIPDTVYLSQRPAGGVSTSLWTYNLKTGAIRTIIREESDLSVEWNANGTQGIVWGSGRLRLIDQNNKTLTSLSLKTLPSKCTFSDSRIYCAAPVAQDSLPVDIASDTLLKKSANYPDDIYSISLLGLNAQVPPIMIKILDSDSQGAFLQASHLEVRGDKLYFINDFDHKLYSLDL